MSRPTNNKRYTQSFIDSIILENHAGASWYSLNKKYGIPESTMRGWKSSSDREPTRELVAAKETYHEQLQDVAKALSIQAADKLRGAIQDEKKVGPLLAVFKEATNIWKTGEGLPSNISEERSTGADSEIQDRLVKLITSVNDAVDKQSQNSQSIVEVDAKEIESGNLPPTAHG